MERPLFIAQLSPVISDRTSLIGAHVMSRFLISGFVQDLSRYFKLCFWNVYLFCEKKIGRGSNPSFFFAQVFCCLLLKIETIKLSRVFNRRIHRASRDFKQKFNICYIFFLFRWALKVRHFPDWNRKGRLQAVKIGVNLPSTSSSSPSNCKRFIYTHRRYFFFGRTWFQSSSETPGCAWQYALSCPNKCM